MTSGTASPGPSTASTMTAPSVRAFAILMLQIEAMLAAVIVGAQDVIPTAVLVAAGFAVHYWLPARMKQPFWIALGFGGLCIHLSPFSVLATVVFGVAPWPVLRSRLPHAAKLILVAALFLLVIVTGKFLPQVPAWSHWNWRGFLAFFGAIFCVRMIVYLHYLKNEKRPPRLTEYLAYFFTLPSYWLFLPFFDFRTMQSGFLRRSTEVLAQEGIRRIVMGGVQIAAFTLVSANFPIQRVDVHSFGMLCGFLALGYIGLYYFGGLSHVAVGMFMLFGYDLPPINRNFALARGPLDFWRRNNIYLKDMMTALVFFPVFFSLSKKGNRRAQVIATAAVFLAVAVLEVWVRSWMTSFEAPLAENSMTSFRVLFGIACTGDALITSGRPKKVKSPWWREAISVVGTMILIATLLPLEWLGSFSEYLDLLIWWR